MSRAERAAEAAQLRAEGLLLREIAERMDICVSYAQQLIQDPEGDEIRARKDSYRGECQECGARTDGSNGRNAPKLCGSCLRDRQHTAAQVRIIAEIQRWHSLYGEVPAAYCWQISNMLWSNVAYEEGRKNGRFAESTIREIQRRHDEDGPWPATTNAQHVFGSWNAAIEAAGFTPMARGHRRSGVAA